jgi:hypothetical protein
VIVIGYKQEIRVKKEPYKKAKMPRVEFDIKAIREIKKRKKKMYKRFKNQSNKRR